MPAINNTHGAAVQPSNDDRAAARERVRTAGDALKAAKQAGTASDEQIDSILSQLRPGDLTEQAASIMMTRIQSKAWTPSDFHAVNEAAFDARAGAYLAIARAVKARLPGQAAPTQTAEDRVAPPAAQPAAQAAAHAPAPRPPRARAAVPASSFGPSGHTMDPATAAAIRVHLDSEVVATNDRALALRIQDGNDDAYRTELQNNVASLRYMLSDGCISQEYFDQHHDIRAARSRGLL